MLRELKKAKYIFKTGEENVHNAIPDPTYWYPNTRNGFPAGYDQGCNIFSILGISDPGKCTFHSDKEKVANKWTRNNASNNEQLDQIYNPLRLSSNRIKV